MYHYVDSMSGSFDHAKDVAIFVLNFKKDPVWTLLLIFLHFSGKFEFFLERTFTK
jgi:hypothetical protein